MVIPAQRYVFNLFCFFIRTIPFCILVSSYSRINNPVQYIYYKVHSAEKIADEALVSTVNASQKSYFLDVEKAMGNATIKAAVQGEINAGLSKEDAVYNYFVGMAQDSVVKAYEEEVTEDMKFLWIKNVWTTDASYKHPVLGYSDFKAEAGREEFEVNGEDVKFNEIAAYTNAYGEDNYNLVTGKLTAQKEEANGYFILIILSIGTILLQQFVMQRSQKAQSKYSSVDGQAASQQKMTMIIMTVMFAIFSFMYSSAFSIYMITSNIFSLCSTLLINKLVDLKMAKKEEVIQTKKRENPTAARIEQAKNAGRESANQSKNKNK